MNRRVVALVLVGVLVAGTLGGVAASALSGSSEPALSGVNATDASATPEAWLAEARAVYDAIAPLTDQAGEAVQRGDDAEYAAANAKIARALDEMPAHPDGQVNSLYAAVAQAHRDIAANADIEGEATIAAQDQVIAMLELVHQIVPPF